jgi:hypothetical protein
MSPDVLRELLGRIPAMLPGVTLSNHSRHPVHGRVYPGVIPTPPPLLPAGRSDDIAIVDNMPTTSSVEGILLLDITPLELRRLDWFEEEGVDYTRTNVRVAVSSSSRTSSHEDGSKPNENNADDDGGNTNSDNVGTQAYLWSLGTSRLDLSRDWDYDAFLRNHLDNYLETTVGPCRIAMEKEIS